MIDFSQLDPEEKLLAARFQDLARIAQDSGRARFSPFLNERQQMLAQETVRQKHLGGHLLYGGFPDATRQVLGFFPEWQLPEEQTFPIVPVAIRLPAGVEASHRDVLGSLLSLGIKREGVGDILFSQRRCDVFVLEPLAPLLVDELVKIGGAGVRCATGVPGEYANRQEYKSISGTVRSARMDALVAILTGLARDKATALLSAELVQRNYQPVRSASGAFAPGDVISIRGYGKYRVDAIDSPTKKGRLPVSCRKYL